MHKDLLLTQDLVYKPAGLTIENLKIEDESAEYGASEFTIKGRSVKFRVAKVTPTKIGQFFTFWKRISKGPILPYEVADSFDFLVVSVRTKNEFGQFIFPKDVLCEKGIVSCHGRGGKRAMRLYPSWDRADNFQAKKSQAWQLEYFIEFSKQEIDFSHLRSLFFIES